MKIINILDTISYGDAVGNEAMAIHRLLLTKGYESYLCADHIGGGLPNEITSRLVGFDAIAPEDLVFYHLSIGGPMNEAVAALPNQKIVRYHNMTPAEFNYGYHPFSTYLCAYGYNHIRPVVDSARLVLADSAYNRDDLRRMGYQGPVEVVPILIPFEDYKKAPDATVVEATDDGVTNVIFVGRVSPNKRQEDIMRAFDAYQKNYNQNARLTIVGSLGEDGYGKALAAYKNQLAEANITFTGHVPFSHILAYYQTADVFLCLSDHEGFCVPLVEAMLFDTPIIAKDAAAVGDTLGGAGILLPDADPLQAAAAIHRVVTDEKLRQQMIAAGRERLKDFDRDACAERILKAIESMM